MRVDCANCGAPNELAALPPDGEVVVCSTCGTRFRAFPPVGFDDGVATQDGESSLPPPSMSSESALRPQPLVEDDVRSNERMALGMSAPTFQGEPTNRGTGETHANDPETQSLPEGGLETQEGLPAVATPAKPKEPTDLYERLEAGLDVSPRRGSDGQRSVQVVVSRIPMAVRVFVVVFAVALFVGALWNAMRTQTIEPQAMTDAGAPVRTASASAQVSTSTTPKVKPRKSPFAEAPAGSLYVNQDPLILKASLAERATEVGTLRIGRLLRVVEEVDGYALVLFSPRGPVGFVPMSALSKARPMPVVARELMPGCDGEQKDACAVAQKGTGPCLERCSELAPDPSVCPEVCSVGLEACKVACEKKPPPPPPMKKKPEIKKAPPPTKKK